MDTASSAPEDASASGFYHWLAGFIDGEGSFVIYLRAADKRPGRSGQRGYTLSFALAVRDDDAPILEEIRSRTGIGCVYRRRRRDTATRVQHAQAIWQVTTKVDLAKLIRILDAYPLRAKKRRDFEVFKRAFELAGTNGRGGNASHRRWLYWQLRQLRQEIGETRVYRDGGNQLSLF